MRRATASQPGRGAMSKLGIPTRARVVFGDLPALQHVWKQDVKDRHAAAS